MMWDDRDNDLGLRDELAALIAVKTSGMSGAIPEQADYDLADECAKLIEKKISLA